MSSVIYQVKYIIDIFRFKYLEPRRADESLLVEDSSVRAEERVLLVGAGWLGHTHVVHLTESLLVRVEPVWARQGNFDPASTAERLTRR